MKILILLFYLIWAKTRIRFYKLSFILFFLSQFIPRIPTLIPIFATPIPRIPIIPTLIPRISTLIPRIPIIPFILFPDFPFWLLQIAEIDKTRSLFERFFELQHTFPS